MRNLATAMLTCLLLLGSLAALAQPADVKSLTDIETRFCKGITGMNVGRVEDVKIDGDHILMKFSTGANTIGTESRLAVRTDTILGKKVLQIEPRGTQTLRPNGVLPLAQSTTPYQIYLTPAAVHLAA